MPDSPWIRTVVSVSATLSAKLDRAADRRCLADDLALPLMQLALEPHHLGRKLIAFERGADLVGDALDEGDVVVVELALLAPDKTEQAEGSSRRRAPARRAPPCRRAVC